jgi:glycerophosphoryl diester phosphodiesterase
LRSTRRPFEYAFATKVGSIGYLAGIMQMPRPVYVISHRANGREAIERAVSAGANGVECDVRAHVVDHDGSFPWSTQLAEWLEAACDAARRYEHFCFVYFDIKQPDEISNLIPTLRAGLRGQLGCLFSIADFDDRQCFADSLSALRDGEGVAIDECSDVGAYEEWLQSRAVRVPSWYSYGSPARKEKQSSNEIMPAIRRAVSRREAGAAFQKVCVWTLASKPLMQTYLEAGIDAMLVEYESLTDALDLVASSARARLATREDRPFRSERAG